MPPRGPGHPYFDLPTPWLVAHRGGSLLAPENTLEAFANAEALGAVALETDVRLSRDGEVMVFHDAETSRLTGQPGTIEGRTRAELEALDAGFGFTPDGGRTFPWRGRGVRIPTLAAVLERFPRLRVNLEAKGDEPALAEALARVLRAHRREGSACVGAAARRQAARLRRLLPEYARYLSTAAAIPHVLAAFGLLPAALAPGGYHLAAFPNPRLAGRPVIGPRLVRYFHGRGMAIQIWTVDDEEEMRRLLAVGVDGIMSDRPDLLAKVLAG
ncbi:MAG TPA: glycerophosphodiester phosphodiesterase [Anaeromyxobacteraceae bacterium]|nr:glycerophosphodiester phosphodiesterase [Anaeromyxobacteraceae bacterium]